MRSRRNPRRASPTRRERRERAVRRAAVLLLLSAVVVVTLVLTAFGSPPSATPTAAQRPPLGGVPETGPPRPQVVATHGALALTLPIAQAQVTAVAYHPAGTGALALRPVGRRGNQGLVRRLLDRVLGGGGSGLTWYQLAGGNGGGPATSALAVGAAPATAVYAPVDGTVIAIDDYVVNGRTFGARIDISPSAAPSLVVSLTRLAPVRSLSVGDGVTAARTRIGRVLDLSGVERQALARYTQDAGNHVTLEVRAAAPVTLG
ncbi:MAG: hypothetical protein ICV64_04255 [Thermoleophilia bacterium]|nr:hypothetical protein [Thermoleophilia bacterium]